MEKRNFLLSVLLIVSALVFAVPMDMGQVEYMAKTQIVSKEIASYNNGKLEKSVSAIDGNEDTKNLQLASAIAISSSEIAYKEGFSVSASVKNRATSNFVGNLGLALYDANFELLTIIDVQDTTISAGATIGCTFTTEGWSELVAGLYYAVIYSKTTGGEWESIGNGSFQNKEQFRIGIIDECSDKVVYECDFESELLDWTFAKADGINTGFAVGSATKYQGEKSLYISPDGGQSTGYTQDSDSGYVSVAYKKIYLEAGSYDFAWRIYRKLSYSYTDVFSDADYYNIAIVPAENEIEAQSSFQRIPSFLNNSVYRYYYTDSYSSWNSYSYNFLISKPGNYYLVHSFSATDTITNTTGVAIDNITIEKRRSKYSSSISVSKTETKEGVVFNISGDYPEYRLYWYTDCDRSYKRDTINTNSYIIPFTKLRDVVRAYGDLYFSVSATDDCGKSTGTSSWYSVYTNEFPVDTCILKPTVKAINTDSGVLITWNGNANLYEFKRSQCANSIINTSDTAYLVPYNKKNGINSEGSTYYFYVRAICDGDTSIWNYASLVPYGPKAQTSDVCWAKPYDLSAQNTSQGIMLSWRGNANKYEIECRSEDEYYRRGDKYRYNDSNYVRFIATDSMYVIPFGVLPDTLYHFRVRAICENDTSFWSDGYKSAYNINFGEYCIPFYDLYSPNTLCTYGSYNNPYSYRGTLDYRQKDWDESYYGSSSGYRYGINGNTDYRSRHTICFEGEVDPRCDSLLTTVPPGEKYSMRLGNWYNGEGESVTYTHKIDSGHKLVLILKYAVVLQDPSHESIENPHFTLEILDENGQLLDSECLYADFAADKNATGWNNAVNAHEPKKEEFRNVVWKDWTTIGVNLSELSKYGDRTIKIRLTTKDCTRGQHYGYAYFTLQCTTANMFGIKCGERPIYFEVAEGFNYRWYLMDDTTKTSVWDKRRFEVAGPDTNSYYVDMISLENENCFYTLKAYTLPRLPQSKIEYKHTPHDCLNEVSFFNKSDVIKIMLDGSFVLDYREIIEATIWDFGEYGTSLEENPKLIVPNEGDTFTIKLKTLSNDCENIAEFLIEVPAIGDTITYDHRFMFEGDTLLYLGKEYYKDGVYNDTFPYTYGCDSIHSLTIEYYQLLHSEPKSLANFVVDPHDCINEVFITNLTEVYSYYTEDTMLLDVVSLIDSIYWDFGVYGTSNDFTPRLIVPNEGDTFKVSLLTMVDGYSDVFEYELYVPAIKDFVEYHNVEICSGGKYVYEGIEYTQEGEYVTSSGKTIHGCDSTHILIISFLQPQVEELYDTICFGDLPYEFYEQQCMISGKYEHTVQAEGGCDSITFILNLFVHEKLVVELNELAEICGDDVNFVISYTISQGTFSSGELQFNQFAKDAGFENVEGFTSTEVVVAIPDSVRPDTYMVDVVFNNNDCEIVTLPLEFTVLYPSSVIGQRWNDFLSVKNEEYNGGYTFTDYQWYLNDVPIEGYKATQIYEYGKELDFEGEYRVLLTRADDGKSIMSCPFIPVRYNEDEYTELSTLVFANQIVVANASHAADVKMYNVAGICVGTYAFEVGYNDVKMPSEAGVYTMQVVYNSDKIQVIRIVVRQ